TIPLNNPDGAQNVKISFGLTNAGADLWWAVDNLKVSSGATSLFTDNFDELKPSLTAPIILPNPLSTHLWTPTPPSGWAVDNSQMPTGGVAEWRGWTFAVKGFWTEAAGDQRRTEFLNGRNVVAIADPDEWDDKTHPPGDFNSFLKTPSI